MKKIAGDHFTHVYQKSQSYDVQFMSYEMKWTEFSKITKIKTDTFSKIILLNVSVLISVIFVQDTRCYTYKESLASIS